ncbi:hypothetical protein M0Q50_01530 [bacterium]|jgi:adenine C2-methylase RlmN of 23S rRNA A2503 and tRNA A37|nr:hypothetical protein [bacterium]
MNLTLIEQKLENQPKYRIKQVRKLIFQDLIDDWDKASVLPLELREELKKECPLEIKHKMFDEGDTLKA